MRLPRVAAEAAEDKDGRRAFRVRSEDIMIVLGVILLIVAFLVKISFLWIIGIILVVVGLILWILGAVGHEVGGRRHYW
ncbi:DUF6131 family protein [Saccharothrix sp. ST-888]|uniref:DUF6131 family protein n=2 Tax=Actinomycetes TaxID=1760 RepID=UPI0012E01C5A